MSEEEKDYTEIFAWGSDRQGQLGFDSSESYRNYSLPRMCSFEIVIRQIACGEEHSAFITGTLPSPT